MSFYFVHTPLILQYYNQDFRGAQIRKATILFFPSKTPKGIRERDFSEHQKYQIPLFFITTSQIVITPFLTGGGGGWGAQNTLGQEQDRTYF